MADHFARIAQAQEKSRARAEHGFGMWKEERARVLHEKQKIVTRLEAASKDWVTAENLDEKIESVIDDFFVLSAHRTELAHQQNTE